MTEPQRSTCLVCDRPPHIRGLCPRCYSEARTAIADDVTTEEELMQRGLMLAPHSRKKVGPLMTALKTSRASGASEAVAQQIPEPEKPDRLRMDSFSYVCDVGQTLRSDLPR